MSMPPIIITTVMPDAATRSPALLFSIFRNVCAVAKFFAWYIIMPKMYMTTNKHTVTMNRNLLLSIWRFFKTNKRRFAITLLFIL